MTTVALEGTGARIVFADSHISADLISLTIDERAREIIETTHLGTPKAKTYTPAKDLTRGKVVAVFDHVPESAILTGRPPQMVRIEYPATDVDVSSISFPAAATRQGKEEMRFDQRMVTEVELVVVDVRDIPGYTVEPVVEPFIDPTEVDQYASIDVFLISWLNQTITRQATKTITSSSRVNI